MANNKNEVTEQYIGELMNKINEVIEMARVVTEAVNKCRTDKLPAAYLDAKRSVSASRWLAQLASSLLTQHDLQEQQKKIDAM
jgi:hypothetical protein